MTIKNKQVSVLFMLLVALFTLCLTAANLFATKQINLGPISCTGALFVFPISYIINDVVAEVWGFRRARLLIWLAFAMNFFFVMMGALVDLIPGAQWWQGTAAGQGFHAIFGLAPRIVVASFLAFLIGSYVNAAVLSKMKIASRGRRFPLRAIVSTIAGETCDSLIFFPIALSGIVSWSQMPLFMLWQVTLKTLYEIIILPVTIRVVKAVKRIEQTDTFDIGIKYRLFK